MSLLLFLINPRLLLKSAAFKKRINIKLITYYLLVEITRKFNNT